MVAFSVSDTEAQMEKFFNIAGSCLPAKHCMLPRLDRMPGIRRLVEQEMYFVIDLGLRKQESSNASTH